MTDVPVLDGDAVAAAVDPLPAIERVRTAFERHATGDWAMPSTVEEITLFDSTGLAIQDLGIAIAVYEAWREDRVPATLVSL